MSLAARLATAASLLYVPSPDERVIAEALASGAGAVVLDLEDAADAGHAREVARSVLAQPAGGGPVRLVRVNAAGTDAHAGDMGAVAGAGLDAVILPKATPEALAALGADLPVVPIIESAAGLRAAHDVARSPQVVALALGAVDLGAELGLEPQSDGSELLYARSKLVVDTAAAGGRPLFDAAFLDLADEAGLETDARRGRALGFTGKACISPGQVATINAVFGR